jgi:flagellar hook assembly protein FlgD
MSISFLTAGGLGGSSAPAELSLYDVNGRRLRSVASGVFEPGSWTARWDGRDDSGHAVASGIYFLRIESGGVDTRIKVAVVR